MYSFSQRDTDEFFVWQIRSSSENDTRIFENEEN